VADITPELALSFLIAYRDRPGCKNSWPVVERAIKEFATKNTKDIPKEVFSGIFQFDYKILRNFEKRGTSLKPRVFDLICLFFNSEEFLKHVPSARNIMQERKESLDDGRILARYLGVSQNPSGDLFEGMTGYWVSKPKSHGLERALYENDKNQRRLVYREVLYINHLFSEPFSFVHCYLQSLINDVSIDKLYDPAYIREYGIEYNQLGVLSGYLFRDTEAGCYRCYLYSRYSGEFYNEFKISGSIKEEMTFSSLDSSVFKSDHISVMGLRKIQADTFTGPFSNDEMRRDFPAKQAVNLFDEIKESVIANG